MSSISMPGSKVIFALSLIVSVALISCGEIPDEDEKKEENESTADPALPTSSGPSAETQPASSTGSEIDTKDQSGSENSEVAVVTPTLEVSSDGIHVIFLPATGDNVYLGCWTCDQYNTDSVHNTYGTYGSPYSTSSFRNKYGAYGGEYAAHSPCNGYALDAPSLFDLKNKNYYGRLSVNRYGADSICNESSGFSSPNDCTVLNQYCAE